MIIMQIQAVVDRFEGNKAVLLVGDDEAQVIWPRKNFPIEVKEGDILFMELAVNKEATAAAKAEAERLLQEILAKNEEG